MKYTEKNGMYGEDIGGGSFVIPSHQNFVVWCILDYNKEDFPEKERSFFEKIFFLNGEYKNPQETIDNYIGRFSWISDIFDFSNGLYVVKNSLALQFDLLDYISEIKPIDDFGSSYDVYLLRYCGYSMNPNCSQKSEVNKPDFVKLVEVEK